MKILILLLVSLVSLQSFAVREVLNGGGGWTSDGQYMTFYSAKIPAQRQALDNAQIPGLSYLLDKVLSLKVNDDVKSQILKQIYPSSGRSYYTTDATKFDPDLKKDLMDKYSRAMNVPEGNVAVYATTDPYSQETFLLPDFYKLNQTEQAAILFHESLWVLNPSLNYSNVIIAEQAAQAYFEAGTVPKNFFNFYYQLSTLVKDLKLPLIATLEFDRLNNNLFPAQAGNKFLLKDLFGEGFLRCILSSRTDQFQADMWLAKRCTQGLLANIVKLSIANPSSLFLKALIDYLKTDGYIVISTYAATNGGYNPSSFERYMEQLYIDTTSSESDTVVVKFGIINDSGRKAAELRFY